MSNTLDPVFTRITSILAGTYPDTGTFPNRQIPPGTFTPGLFNLPRESPVFPSQAVYATPVDRVFDLLWAGQEYDAGNAANGDPGAENQSQGPHIVDVYVDLRISYKLVRPPPLSQPDNPLVMGALEACSRRAANDWRCMEWALGWYLNWQGVTPSPIECIKRRGPTVTRATGDQVRIELVAPLLIQVVILDPSAFPGLGT